MMKTLFDPVVIGGIPLKNRLIRSATFESASDGEGFFANSLIAVYNALADGGIGAIITGMMAVDENSAISPAMVKTYADDFVPELDAVVKWVHEHGAKLVVQLAHCGVRARDVPGGPLAPSEMELHNGEKARAMSEADIAALAKAFGKAAAACKAAGADGVQIHAAHGYLLSQFLSPWFNKRTDAYGGDIAGRGRVVIEVYDAIRESVGEGYPVWMKINGTDLVENSMTLDECLWLCEELTRRGLDAVEVSGGIALNATSSSLRPVVEEREGGGFGREASMIADALKTQVISVCGYRSPDMIESWLKRTGIAAISLARPLICEPGLPKRWQEGRRQKARCISCNRCLSTSLSTSKGLACQVFK